MNKQMKKIELIMLTMFSLILSISLIITSCEQDPVTPPEGDNSINYSTKIVFEDNLKIADKEGSVINKYELLQNYSNPFNPVTQIQYQIVNQGMVTLKVYDLLGREVKVLVNEIKSPGNHSVTFDASSLSSGVYFYKMTAGDFSDVRRMVLVK